MSQTARTSSPREAKVEITTGSADRTELEVSRAIAAAVDDAGIVCGVGYQYRAIEFLADLAPDAALLLGTGVSGTVQRAWLGDRARGGGMILERASHLIDLERALAGDVEAVSA